MSEQTGFTNRGFFPRTPDQIERDYQTAGANVLEEINYDPGSPIYQIFKIARFREYQIELALQSMVSGLSVETAYGEFLEKIGEGLGIFKKQSEYAGGYVHVTYTPPSAGSQYNLGGIEYFTNKGQKFTRTQDPKILARYIRFKRGKISKDGLPSPFASVSGIGYVNSQSDGSGTEYDPTFNSTEQVFDWSSAVTGCATGAFYYAEITNSITLKDYVVADEAGTGYNVGANTLVKFRDSETPFLPSNSTVNNPYALTGGAGEESDDTYRARIKKATSASFTRDKIRDIAENINGVRSAKVYQALGTDIKSCNGTWDSISGYASGIDITGLWTDVSGALWQQRFSPTQGIANVKKVIFRGKRIGYPPPLIVGLRQLNETPYEATGSFDTFELDPPTNTVQDLVVDLEFLDLDYSFNYCFEFWCANKTGASGSSYWSNNYWTLITGLESGNLGDGDQYTGLLYDPTGNTYNSNLMFKTRYASFGVNIDLALEDGAPSFDQIKSTLDKKLDWEKGNGYAVAGIDYAVRESDYVYIYAQGTLFIESDISTDFSSISARVDSKLQDYVNKLQPGENVVYSKIYYNLMKDPDIWRIADLKIYESGGVLLEDEDIFIDEQQVAYWGGSDFDRG